MDERKRYDQGMKTRRAVLGDAHVDRTLKNRTKFNEPFQDLITRYAWGEIWSRPGLPRKTRSLLTLSMLVALNREPEFRMHLKAALSLGVSRDEIQEVLLQAAIYCGVPAANSAFHTAEEVFESSQIQNNLAIEAFFHRLLIRTGRAQHRCVPSLPGRLTHSCFAVPIPVHFPGIVAQFLARFPVIPREYIPNRPSATRNFLLS